MTADHGSPTSADLLKPPLLPNSTAPSTRAMSPPDHSQPPPLGAWFLGPRAENAELWRELLDRIFQDYVHWRRNYFPEDPIVVSRADRRSEPHERWVDDLVAELDGKLGKLKEHFPFHSPRYNAHMLSEQTLPSVLGYFAGMLYNPNNVTEEAAPITVHVELEVGRTVAAMLGYERQRAWAHLCSGGTIATLEALWVARTVQFTPFAVRQYCIDKHTHFTITTANGDSCDIRDVADDDLLFLPPQTSISMLHQLQDQRRQRDPSDARLLCSQIEEYLQESEWSVRYRGLPSVLARLQPPRRPRILASDASHYSIEKAANLLGYGEDAVVRVRSNAQFQLDTDHLRERLWALAPHDYVAAVVGIVGTTEEGAVDPIHKIVQIREDYQKQKNRSFWLHIDAAWGGYLRTIFLAEDAKDAKDAKDASPRFISPDEWRDDSDPPPASDTPITADPLSQSILERLHDPVRAMSRGDSTTIDPHKLGYVPYPAGMVAFPDKAVKHLLAQRAPYIDDQHSDTKIPPEERETPQERETVGPHIIEGSKPGAAALACWLAHRTIPLHRNGHGYILQMTLRQASELRDRIKRHRTEFQPIHDKVTQPGKTCLDPFVFIPLCEPDTNIVCFVARPMLWRDSTLVFRDLSLKWINEFNRRIWRATSIDLDADRGHERQSSAQPFFVSRTELEEPRDGGSKPLPIGPVLDTLSLNEAEYREHGLFVLRSVVMNPWHERAEDCGMDYLEAFVEHLHRAAADALGPVLEEAGAEDRRQWGP